MGIKEPKKWICDRFVASIVGGSLMKVRYIRFFNKQVTSWRFTIILEDDVMASYKIFLKVLKKGILLSIED